jgi:hypothetical protein
VNFSEYIELINEGGAAGHMAHPFDIQTVRSGKNLIEVFEKTVNSIRVNPPAVKIDGVNASIRLVDIDGIKQFVIDRGSKKDLDVRGVTEGDLLARFGPGHGMIQIGTEVLRIFNESMNSIITELKDLGVWKNSNIMFNMEYVAGKTNVQQYNKKFLAIHGLLQISTEAVQGKRSMLINRVTREINYKEKVMESLINKISPIARKYGFEIYGSIPASLSASPDFTSVLGKIYTINFSDRQESRTLRQWLMGIRSIPKNSTVDMIVDGVKKTLGAVSKQVYFSVIGGEVVDNIVVNSNQVNTAIDGAITYLATEKMGDAILDCLDSPLGKVSEHEGIVIRDSKISSRPFKITGRFITTGVESQFRK